LISERNDDTKDKAEETVQTPAARSRWQVEVRLRWETGWWRTRALGSDHAVLCDVAHDESRQTARLGARTVWRTRGRTAPAFRGLPGPIADACTKTSSQSVAGRARGPRPRCPRSHDPHRQFPDDAICGSLLRAGHASISLRLPA